MIVVLVDEVLHRCRGLRVVAKSRVWRWNSGVYGAVRDTSGVVIERWR